LTFFLFYGKQRRSFFMMVSLTVFPSFFSKVAIVNLCLQLSVTHRIRIFTPI
jgi:hypothetical protein